MSSSEDIRSTVRCVRFGYKTIGIEEIPGLIYLKTIQKILGKSE